VLASLYLVNIMINLRKTVLFQALECGAQPIVIVEARNADLPIAYVNPAYEALTGRAASAVIGAEFEELVFDGEIPGAHNVSSAEWMGVRGRRLVQRWRVANGEPLEVEVHVSPIYETPGQPTYWLITQVQDSVQNIEVPEGETVLKAALRDARRQVKYLEQLDPATGVPNRKMFTESLRRDWGIARREERRVGVIMFRVNALDGYHDLFGRHATDSVLRKIGHAITGTLRRVGDLGARYDKDRFVVLLGSCDEDQAMALAENITSKVRKLSIHHPRSPERFVSVSYSVATAIPDRTEPSTVLINQVQSVLDDYPESGIESPDSAASSNS